LAAHAALRVLGLDEVADVGAVGQHGARAQPRIGADLHRAFAARAVDVAVRAHLGAGAEHGVADAAERADAHAVAQLDPAFEHHVDVDLDVAADRDFATDVDARRIGQARALHAQCPRLPQLERALQLRELPGIVGALGL